MNSTSPVKSFLPITYVLMLLCGINSNSQSINDNDSLQIVQSTKKVILRNVKNVEEATSLISYMDTLIGKTLISGLTIKEGHIVSEGMLQATGSTTFTLSNGIKVHYKFVNKNKDHVQLKGISYGGFSLVKEDAFASAQVLEEVVSFSGLGDYSAADLSKILAGNTANTNICLFDLAEVINGASSTEDVETLLQMVYLRFVNPRFDKSAYQTWIRNLNSEITGRRHAINEKIRDSIPKTIYRKDDSKQHLINYDFVKELSFEKIKTVYLEHFDNAANFEFFIVGDLQMRALRPLLEKYMASIPTNRSKEIWGGNSESWLENTIEKETSLDIKNSKNMIRLGFKNTMTYNLKNALIARVLGDILQFRFTEILQEDERAYNVYIEARMSKRPIEQASLHIAIDVSRDSTKQFEGTALKELEKITKGGISQIDLEKAKANFLKRRKQQQEHNSYDMCVLINYFRKGYNMNASKNFECLLKAITIKDIEVFAKALIKR